MVINVTFTYICSICGEKHEETHCVRLGSIPNPYIPYGWNMLNHTLYCPKHTITITTEKNKDIPKNQGIDGDV